MASKKNSSIRLPVFNGGWWFYDAADENSRLNAFVCATAAISIVCVLYFIGRFTYSALFLEFTSDQLWLLSKTIANHTFLFIVFYAISFWAINSLRWLFYFSKGYEMRSQQNVMSLDSHPFFSLVGAAVSSFLVILATLILNFLSLIAIASITYLFGHTIFSVIALSMLLAVSASVIMRKRNLRRYEVLHRLEGD